MDELDFFDCLILDGIQRYGALRDVELSRRLQCPRTLLLDRLELLCQEGYVWYSPQEQRYVLTEEGQKEGVPLHYLYTAPEERPKQEDFDWTALYLPQRGWQENS